MSKKKDEILQAVKEEVDQLNVIQNQVLLRQNECLKKLKPFVDMEEVKKIVDQTLDCCWSMFNDMISLLKPKGLNFNTLDLRQYVLIDIWERHINEIEKK